MELTTFIHGSAHHMPQLADGSVQVIATSPPYYGLRLYQGEQGVEWPEVTFRLNEWVEPTTVAPMHCGLGMEPSPVAFIGHLILCLREWRRVLRDDGVIFCNLGDSYAANGGAEPMQTLRPVNGASDTQNGGRGRKSPQGVKPKDLLGIPWLFAIAARADGWFLRSDIIWAKPNPMPESVTDRPTKAHEYIFLLTKSQRYFWDAEGVKEKAIEGTDLGLLRSTKAGTDSSGMIAWHADSIAKRQVEGVDSHNGNPSGTRNLRTVWTIATQPTPFAHFATFPEKLVEPMIRAGSSERGACPHCGKAWVRVVEKSGGMLGKSWHNHADDLGQGNVKEWKANGDARRTECDYKVNDLGFSPACTCPAHEPVPCVVLDPFNGSGTTAKVAVRLGRAYVGVDISQEYLDGVTTERFGAGVQIGFGL